MPARNARHAKLFTWQGAINLKNAKYIYDESPIDPECDCPVCRRYSKAYLHHLFKAEEMLAMRLSVMHNLYFYNKLMNASAKVSTTARLRPSVRSIPKNWRGRSDRTEFILENCSSRLAK